VNQRLEEPKHEPLDTTVTWQARRDMFETWRTWRFRPRPA